MTDLLDAVPAVAIRTALVTGGVHHAFHNRLFDDRGGLFQLLLADNTALSKNKAASFARLKSCRTWTTRHCVV